VAHAFEQVTQRPDALHAPLYEAAEVARLLHLTPSRVRRWLFGYEFKVGKERRARAQRPVVHRGTERSRHASFLDLIDLLGAKAFLDEGLSLQKIRKAFDEAEALLNHDHPFARRRFFASGGRIYLEMPSAPDARPLLELLSGGQWAIGEVIRSAGKQIDFDPETDLALSWWPLGRDVRVVLDPRFAFGAPTVAGRGVKTTNVYDSFLAEGRKIDRVVRWMHLEPEEVRSAVRFEEWRAAQRAA